jgi:hypothetical protein
MLDKWFEDANIKLAQVIGPGYEGTVKDFVFESQRYEFDTFILQYYDWNSSGSMSPEDKQLLDSPEQKLKARQDYVVLHRRITEESELLKQSARWAKTRKRAPRSDVIKKVALALSLIEKFPLSLRAAADKAHTTTGSINEYENLPATRAALDNFKSKPEEASRYQAHLNQR